MPIYRLFLVLFLSIFLIFLQSVVAAEEKGELFEESLKVGDPELDVLWIDERNGDFIPLDVPFTNEEGEITTFGEIIDRPTVILPIYFYCPSSCSLNLVNLATAVKRSRLDAGKDFKIIAFSFNENENEENSRIAKRNYMRLLPENFPEKNWRFLTGSKESIEAVTQAIGYTFKPQEDGLYIHPSALVVAAEDGKIIKYVYGKFVPGDVDMAIAEAEKGTPAISVKRFLNYCFNYSPDKTSSFFKNIKIAVLAGFALFGLLFILYVKRADNKKSSPPDEQLR